MNPVRALLTILLMPLSAHAEEGDQFLDGIGETALVARYVFDGDLEDWSRNGLHATDQGEAHQFVEDETFGKVLSLSGNTFLSVPVTAFQDAVSFSATGWVKVQNETAGQSFFDFGKSETHHLGLIPMGEDREGGCALHFASGTTKASSASFRVRADEWVHLAAVLDAADKTLSLYVDGKRVAREENLGASIASFFDKENPGDTRLYLGRTVTNGGPNLTGQLHDVRFYRSALSDRQVEAIHHNAISEEKITASEEASNSATARNPLYESLESVPNIEVTTEVGHLPHLPYDFSSSYPDGKAGPPVRVLWPSPTDNSAATEVGSYTITGKIPGTTFEPRAKVTVVAGQKHEAAPEISLQPFPLGQVTLNPDKNGEPTLFMQHRAKFLHGLSHTDPDRFLWVFRNAFGQTQPEGIEPLGVWDSPTTRLRGHATGHYLTALAQAYASTSDDPELHAVFAKKMDHMIDVLHDLSLLSGNPAEEGSPSVGDPTQVPPGPGREGYDSDLSEDGIRTDYWNWGHGFISGYPPDQFIMLENGASYGGGNDQVWAPYYTLHKILAGLVDCYEVGGNPKALEVAKGMGLWVHARLAALPQETLSTMWNRYIAGEYGGMNEIMARLHHVTGEQKFLETAKLFDNTRFFFGDADHQHGLAKNVDTIRGLHANQHIPQIIGALETYRGTGDPAYYDVASNFWTICQHSYLYAIGGVAGARNPNNAECFPAEPDSLFHNGLSEGGQNETCATYNLLKLGRELFRYQGDARFMDYYEQAIYNHILASVAADSPANTYHVPLNPGSRKSFGNPDMDGFTCCNGTAIESGTKLQDTIYFKSTDNRALYVNLFVPSTLVWKERGVKVTQETNFPFEDTTRIILGGSGEFPIFLRIPDWADKGVTLRINGEKQDLATSPGTYLKLDRNWQSGDTIDLQLPFNFYLRPLMDQPNIASLFYGPVLLAAEEPGARKDFRRVQLDFNHLEESITGDPSTLHFQTGDTRFKPFFEFHDDFHSAYFDLAE